MFVRLKNLSSIQLWLFCLSVSLVTSEIIVVGMEILLKGVITYDFLLTGFVASLLVGALTVNLVSFFLAQQRKAEAAILLQGITANAPEGVVLIHTANSKIIYTNHQFDKMFGYDPGELIGQHISEINATPNIFSEISVSQLNHAIEKNGVWSGEILNHKKDGSTFWASAHVSSFHSEDYGALWVWFQSDITERKKNENEIYHLAFYDPLTGLPNRRLLLDRLSVAISASERSKQYGALLFLDLDNFKTLNDTMGHEAGDRLLVEVAHSLKLCLREVDTVARFGGDEFVVLIENISTDANDSSQIIAQIAEKIRETLVTPYQIHYKTHHSSTSIGVCLFCGNEISVDELVKYSDIAMYEAKDSGRNKVRFFDPQLQKSVESHAALESDLRRAINAKQLRLYYQIQVDDDLRQIGAEALIRWIHPHRGLVSPSQFIPLAEESSLILEIGSWVLDTACEQIAKWGNNKQTSNLVVAVNISAKQFMQADFVEQVSSVLKKHNVDPACLKLELTESIVLDDLVTVVEKMVALKQVIGVTLSLDDFGTGYSSLSYLKRLPLDQIKIDQSFVRDMTKVTSDAVMVKTIIGLAQNFGLNVIAEGVETDEHLAFLKEYGCTAYQGYLFSKPLPLERFEALILKKKR